MNKMNKIVINRTGQEREEIQINGFFFDVDDNKVIMPKYMHDGEDWIRIEEDHIWDESNVYRYTNYIRNELLGGRSRISIMDGSIGSADAITSNLAKSISKKLQHYFNGQTRNTEVVLVIGGNEIWIEKPYAINGIKMSLKELSFKFSRIIQAYGNIFNRHESEEHKSETKKAIRRIMKTPEDILYCLENRVPFYFFTKGKKENVRLNLKQIGTSNYALEISDGKWGEIKESDLTTYLGHYLHRSEEHTSELQSRLHLVCRLLLEKKKYKQKKKKQNVCPDIESAHF